MSRRRSTLALIAVGLVPLGGAIPGLVSIFFVPTQGWQILFLVGGIAALSDVSLEARPGQVTALIGPNGSGKTTLLNMVCGFYRLDRGSISIGGAPLAGRRPHQVPEHRRHGRTEHR